MSEQPFPVPSSLFRGLAWGFTLSVPLWALLALAFAELWERLL